VRRGEPRAGGTAEIARDPRFSTAIGLMHYGLRADEQRFFMGRVPKGLFDRVTEWLGQVF
jgi:cell division ATPase FtsA